ncbi:MAG: hypothetical protein NZ522_08400, partial [Chitinophagales bacterium]|nr:hypothetical protein [Chitinophagales bacterium]
TLKISIIPVLDEDENYLGVITADSLLRALCHFSSWQEEGSIIEIEMPSRNYSLYEIARLVEGNNLKILSSFTHLRPDTQTTVVTLKINSLNLESIVSAFERYGISVNGVYHETEYSEDLRERYDSLMRYLNV